MIDFHSHILPKIDDGSQSIRESIKLLKLLSEQNVETVAATPHFYASQMSIEKFLFKRQVSFENMKLQLSADFPAIVLGAEVLYYSGISRTEDLLKLRLEGTNLLLLEMPVEPWSEYTVQELTDLTCSGNITLVLAHIERYLRFQKRSTWETLRDNGVLMQVNASFFLSLQTKHKALKMLKDEQIHFIGSDCHNLTNRRPRLAEAYDVIRKKFGDEFLEDMNNYHKSILEVERCAENF